VPAGANRAVASAADSTDRVAAGALAVRIQSGAGHQEVKVRMELQALIPGVEHGGEAVDRRNPWSQEGGPTVFAPFPADSEYFGDVAKQWMINFRVSDLDAVVGQLRAAGVAVTVDPEIYPNGRFARLQDPEGNPIQLWEAK